jgi:hypothetical protein
MIPTLALDVLALMHALITEGWCKGTMATTERAGAVGATSRHAAHWCLVGAKMLAWETMSQDLPAPMRRRLSLQVNAVLRSEAKNYEDIGGVCGLTFFNDDARNRRPVLALIERAAARLGKR